HLYRLERKLSPAVGDGCSGLHGPIVNGQGNSNNQQSFYEYPSKIRRWRILRQGKIERRPFARPTLGPHLSTVTLHDMFNNRKSKTCPALLARTRFVHAIKAFKNALQRLRRDSRSIIFHRHFNLPTVHGARPNGNVSFFSA